VIGHVGYFSNVSTIFQNKTKLAIDAEIIRDSYSLLISIALLINYVIIADVAIPLVGVVILLLALLLLRIKYTRVVLII